MPQKRFLISEKRSYRISGHRNSEDKIPESLSGDYQLHELSNPEVVLGEKAFRALGQLQSIPSYQLSQAVKLLEPGLRDELLESNLLYRLQTGNMTRYGLRSNLLPFAFPVGTAFSLDDAEEERLLQKCRQLRSKTYPHPIKAKGLEQELFGLISLVHSGRLLAKRELKNSNTNFYLVDPRKGD